MTHPPSHEYASCIVQQRQPRLRILNIDYQMLRGVGIADAGCLLTITDLTAAAAKQQQQQQQQQLASESPGTQQRQ